MTEDVDTFATVYVHGPASRRSLAETVGEILGAPADEWCTVVVPDLEVQARDSDEYSEGGSREFPTGFYSFPYLLEFDFASAATPAAAVSQVSAVLRGLWDRGLPAVATAEYGDDLPGDGGLEDGLPWPGRA